MKKEFTIRNLQQSDIAKIKEFNFYFGLLYEFNRDFIVENILCAVTETNDILGVVHLEPDNTFFLIDKERSEKQVYKLKLGISLNSNVDDSIEVKNELIQAIKNRAKDIKNNYPSKNIKIINYFTNEDIQELNEYIRKGFFPYKTILVMKRDLTVDFKDVKEIENVRILKRKLTSDNEKEEYLQIEALSNDGVCMSLNQLNWQSYAPNCMNYSAYYQNQFIGNVMTWQFSEEHSATEYIFISPEYQNKGIGKYMVNETLKALQSEGKKQATLSLYVDNKKALSSYLSLGYTVQSFIYECAFDI